MNFPRLRPAMPVVCEPIDRVVAPAPGWLKVYCRTVGGIQLLYAGFFGWVTSWGLVWNRFCHHAWYGKGEYSPAYLDWEWLSLITVCPLLALTGFAGGCSLLFLRPSVSRWQFAYMMVLSLSLAMEVEISLSSHALSWDKLAFRVFFSSSSVLALPYLPFLFTSVTAALTGAPAHSGPRVPVIGLIAAFLIGWFGFLLVREYEYAREDRPFLMKITPAPGGCLVRFYQPSGGLASPEFTVDLPVEAPLEFELRPDETQIPLCTVEFCGTTLLPKRCRLRVRDTPFDLTEDRIKVGGRTYRWTGQN